MINNALTFALLSRRSATAASRVAILAPLLVIGLFMAGCGTSARVGGCADADWSPPGVELKRTVSLPRWGSATPASGASMIILPFDASGQPCADGQAHLDAALKQERFTDIYVLCPGWNDGWYSAAAWLDAFATGHEQARVWAAPNGDQARAYKPLYIGVLWPGAVMNSAYPARTTAAYQQALRPGVDRTALLNVLNANPSEKGVERVLQALLDLGHQRRVIALRKLLDQKEELTPPQQLELAECLLPLFGPQAEPSAPGPRFALTLGQKPVDRLPEPGRVGMIGSVPAALPRFSAAELLEVWKTSVRTASATIPRAAEEPADDASLARRRGLSVPQLVRWALYAADLRVVKNRAYVVGKTGLAATLATLRSSSDGQIHLVGHSFGAEVILSALATLAPKIPNPSEVPTTQPRRIADTLLLLSPLVNAWALGQAPPVGKQVLPSLQSQATPGAYRNGVLQGVSRSVTIVYSTRDWFAAFYAPLALRRPLFEGMASPDTWAGEGQGFATLGGAGPGGLEPPAPRFTLIAPGAEPQGPLRYNFAGSRTSAPAIVAIDGSARIWAHGDANDRAIWWLLANQVIASD